MNIQERLKQLSERIFALAVDVAELAASAREGARPAPEPGSRRRWTDDEDDDFRARWDAGESMDSIARTLQRTIPSLVRRAQLKGFPRR